MDKPTLEIQMLESVRNIVKLLNEKIGEEHFQPADIELRPLFGAIPVEWEAKIWAGHCRFEERAYSPVMTLQRLYDSISKADFS